ncbi:host-nuclease inhibitor Gam family protein [Sphingobium aquiterrae]|uniref:host-nuclease inhibitor Gam family protein n=1 Tax=Sphingobium aquiterrae TaxID=2038656 RepID=UPI0030161934
MAVSRRKAPKQQAPQTIEEATALIAKYRDFADVIDMVRSDAATAIAKIETARDETITPLDVDLKAWFRQLRAWWGVAAPELTEGKRKSIELCGCIIGERKTTPALKHDGITAEQLIEDLGDIGADGLLSIKLKLDKQACIRAIGAGDELGQLLLWLGARREQKEEFFIDTAPKKDASPEVVDVEEAAE